MSQKKPPENQGTISLEEALERIRERRKVGSDTLAKKEKKDLEGDAKRVEEFKEAFHKIFIWTVRILFGLGIAVVIVRIYHLLAPYSWQWLCETQISNLDKILFSGAIGGFVGKYFKSMFSNTTDYSKK